MYSEEKILIETKITEDGTIFTHEITNILKDREIIATTHQRNSFIPLLPISELPQAIRDIATLRWTEDVIERYKQSFQIINPPE